MDPGRGSGNHLGMGAWGYEAFENDMACDWLASFVESGDLGRIEAALRGATDASGDYLDSREGSVALGACEVVASVGGRPLAPTSYTERLFSWLQERRPSLPPGVVSLAIEALDRVADEESELVDEWDRSPDWLAAVAGLRERLTSLSQTPR